MAALRFEKTEQGAALIAAEGAPAAVEVPAEYEGVPVTAVGRYAFSGQRALRQVTLPGTLRELGDHAFYNCEKLERLAFGQGVRAVGDGVFKNCRALRAMRVGGTRYCKQLLTDLMNEITLTVCGPAGRQAVLLFPEYFYEFLENVPPREFRSVTYGSGAFYRMCLSAADIDFNQYDSTFPRAVREDAAETVQRIALCRLQYPYRLRGDHRAQYAEYLREHAQETLAAILDRRSAAQLETLLHCGALDEGALGEGIRNAARADFPEAVSLLMEYRLARFGGRKRRFVL